jgi:hypothetical protein
MKRVLGQILKFSLAFAVLLYVLDWAVLEVRIQRQTGYGNVQVKQFLITPLKGQKEEFDFMGTKAQSCVNSIFPHVETPACWWVERHRTEWEE